MNPYHTFQSRESWLNARRGGIGGSDAGSVLGINPYKSNVQLWEEKTGRAEPEDVSGKPAVQYGTEAEAPLRWLFRLDHPEYRVSFTPFKVFYEPEFSFVQATPDGELEEVDTGRKGGLEIKTATAHGFADYEKWNDRVPDHYYAQVLHQMLATGWDFVVLLAQIKRGRHKITKEYYFSRDACLADMDALLVEEKRFWELVRTREEPAMKLPII